MDHKKWWYVNAGLIIIISFAACERFGLPATTLYVSDDRQKTEKNYVFEASNLDESKLEDGHVITKRDSSAKENSPDHKSNITTKVRKDFLIKFVIYVCWAFYVCSMRQSCFEVNNAIFVLCNRCTFKSIVF